MLEVLIVLAGLVALAIPAILIVIFVLLAGAQRRIDTLERDLRALAEAQPRRRAGPAAARDAAAEARTASEPERKPDPEAAREAPVAAPAAPAVPQAPSPAARAVAWLRLNWVYAVSALSLALAGVFLVQYGVETGLLTPAMRVILAAVLGVLLIGAGETIRRRWGDEGGSTAFLPSTFSAAGIVVLYVAILAARGLYGLIGPEMAFAGLLAISALAVVFGWFYGPFLAAAGISGAAAAPFLVGGTAESGMPFYMFYALLAATGLAIDALRRWGWVSLLALVLSYLLGTVVLGQGGEVAGFLMLVAWLALAAIALPRLELWPSHPGPAVIEALATTRGDKVIAPVWIAAGAVLASCLLLAIAPVGEGVAAGYLALGLLVFLIVALALWAHRAPGLADLALIPALTFLLVLIAEAGRVGDLFRTIALYVPADHPEAAPPATVTVLVGLAALGTLAAAWRAFRAPYARFWAAGAAIFAPAAAVIFELFWQPAPAIGGFNWAGHVLALAALMTVLAERFARAEGGGRGPAAYAVLSALSLIALALFILLSDAALTVALAVLLAAAAALDRRFDLPEMAWFLIAGCATLGWRLVIDPGLPAYLGSAPMTEVSLAFGAALAGTGSAMALLPDKRLDARAVLESALWAFGGVFASVLTGRWIDAAVAANEELSHWTAALFGLVWTFFALAQAYRLARGGRLRWLRIGLGTLYALGATLAFLLVLTLLNPAVGLFDKVRGLQPFDSLSLAYAAPGVLFALVALRADWLARRSLLGWLGGLFLVVWGFLEIRWFWRGEMIGQPGFTQPELYSYTVALLLIGAGFLYQAIARQSPGFRRLAMAVIALTVAKVFLVDTAGLTGLLRVFSFLALGLALAGLAWLNLWAAGQRGHTTAPGA